MQLDKKSKKFIITFFLIILIPVIVIGFIRHTKEQKLKSNIENSKSTRVLSLNNISTAITLEELLNIETSNEHTIKDSELNYENDENKRNFTVTYLNASYFGGNCTKEYYFVDEKLKMCIFTVDTSHWTPKNIYEELININGNPDTSKIDENSFYLETYTWYGKNGTILYNKLNNNTIEIIFQLSEHGADA